MGGGGGFFPGVKRRGVILTAHLHLAPRLTVGGAILLLPPYAFIAETGVKIDGSQKCMVDQLLCCLKTIFSIKRIDSNVCCGLVRVWKEAVTCL
jgi:hypothetical protein